MRRPSPIPVSAPPPAEEAPSQISQEPQPERLAPAWPARDGSAAEPGEQSRSDEHPTVPIAFEARGGLALSVSDGVGVDGSDPESTAAPLTARDLWAAAKARRRALRAEIRRFTQRSRRRRIGWIVGLLIAVVVVGGSVGAAYSPLFAVRTITVEGTSALKAADVQKALFGEIGTPLALVDTSAVKAALVRFPLIETYQLEAHPPHDLVVRIVERTPVGVVRTPAGFTVVDAAGVVLSTTPKRPPGYALIDLSGGTETQEFGAVGTVLRTLPAELRAQVDSVAATTPDDIVLQLTGGATVIWGSADRSALKTLTLQRLMAASPGSTTFDVSSPGVGVVG